MEGIGLKDLQGIEKDLLEVIRVNINALDTVLRSCDKAGLVRITLAGLAFPDRPKYDLDSPAEVECYSIMQDIQEAHFKLFGVKAGIYEIEGETSKGEGNE